MVRSSRALSCGSVHLELLSLCPTAQRLQKLLGQAWAGMCFCGVFLLGLRALRWCLRPSFHCGSNFFDGHTVSQMRCKCPELLAIEYQGGRRWLVQ
mmetsp:Transcript_104943/g.306533  ORF Transcript_104943/g.306533 Transcript_104943/m.306533 type:complete len:96 (-) Transcript_104943:55-342(-)